ncbi:MAG: tRNA-dihydrouridine synthase [Desulfovibrionales bacterium]|nr:tRNA-dihydrouridine synthase [Desulfovibrionales bacterium]
MKPSAKKSGNPSLTTHPNGAGGTASRAVFFSGADSNPAPPFQPDAPWLAPMAGYSDLPFRLLCRRYGAAAAVSEMVSAKGLVMRQPGTNKLLDTCPEDSPLVVQLFGVEPEVLAEAVRILRDRGFRLFDLNAGCPVRKVAKTGAGAALLKDMDQLVRIVEAMAEAAGDCRVGVKLRPGFETNDVQAVENAPRLESAGASWLAFHPRFGKQMFSGTAHMELLAAFKSRTCLPVVGSGDLFSAQAGAYMIRSTGVESVMYARGALADPAVFLRHVALVRGEAAPQGLPGPAEMIREHIALARGFEDSERTLRRMRSIVPRYIRELHGAKTLRQRLTRCENFAELDEAIDEIEAIQGAAVPGNG